MIAQGFLTGAGGSGTIPWDTSALTDGVNYLIQVEAFDTANKKGMDASDTAFSVDNVLVSGVQDPEKAWHFQVQSTGLYQDLDMKPVENFANTVSTLDLNAAGQYMIQRWETVQSFSGEAIDGPWDFNIYGYTSNPGVLDAYLYAVIKQGAGTIDTTVLDDENLGAFSSSHLFTWSDTLAGTITGTLGVELWVEVVTGSGGSASLDYGYAGVVQADPYPNAYFCDVDAYPPEGGNLNSQVELTDAQYVAVAASDDNRAISVDPGFGDEIFTWCDHEIVEDPSWITQIDLTFEGQAAAATNFQVHAYNYATSSWTGTPLATIAVGANTDGTVTGTISANCDDYISGSGILTWGCYQTDNSDLVRVDYLVATIYFTAPPAVFNMEYDYGATQSNVLPSIGGGAPPYDIDLTGYAAGDWVFVSFPIDISGTVDVILNDANGDGGTTWDVAQWYDNLNKEWRTYSIHKPASINDMDIIGCANGFWLHLTANAGDEHLTTGTGGWVPAAPSIDLFTGWNLVGYPSSTPEWGDVTLPPEADLVAVYSGGAPYRILDAAPAAIQFLESYAYWVRVTADCTWNP
jgi:hypothetical protein